MGNKMNPADHARIARIIRWIYDPRERETVAYHFCAELARGDDDFDAATFLKGCGVNNFNAVAAREFAKHLRPSPVRTQSRLNRAQINRNRVRIGLKPLGAIGGDDR